MSAFANLELRVAALEAAHVRRGKWVESYRSDLLEAAMRYANLKVFRSDVNDDGATISYNAHDADLLAENCSRDMERIAVQLLREMAKEEPAT